MIVSNLSNDSSSDEGAECDLAESYSFILQSVLGFLAFSTLILKRYREPKLRRRPFWIWVADTTKQALGMLEMHFINLTLSVIFKEKECVSYLVNFLLDSTIGLLLIFVLLKLVRLAVSYYSITSLVSGEYGEPFHCSYWLAQCAVYLVVVVIEKVLVGPCILFPFWTKVEHYIPGGPHLRIAIVIFIIPFVVNVIMFWIVDSILMRKTPSHLPGVVYHKPEVRYNKLQVSVESCESEEELVRLGAELKQADRECTASGSLQPLQRDNVKHSLIDVTGTHNSESEHG